TAVPSRHFGSGCALGFHFETVGSKGDIAMSRIGRKVSCACGGWLVALTFAAALDFPVWTPPASMYRAHREKFLAKLPAPAIARRRPAPKRPFPNDTESPSRQDSVFHYPPAFDEPDSVAVFRPTASDGKRYLLYVRAHDPRREAYDGTRPGPEGAVSEYGAEAAYPIGDFLPSLSRYEPTTRSFIGHLAGVETLYLSDAGDAAWAEKVRGA